VGPEAGIIRILEAVRFLMKNISSLQNPLIKQVHLLSAKARERRQSGLFVVEGLREAAMALDAGFAATHLFFDPAITPEAQIELLLGRTSAAPPDILTVSPAVFEKIAYRSGVPNVVLICRERMADLEGIQLAGKPLALVLEAIEKPGNLGAILRTADAAGVDAVLVCDPATDLFNPNTIRASLGAVFTTPVCVVSSETAWTWLQVKGMQVFATHLEASRSLYDCDLRGPSALVMGAEATGISPFWEARAHQRIIIPMRGKVDSMNVSASTAIVLFEAVRQRLG
jgi:TrmH family RNA methyltransferase